MFAREPCLCKRPIHLETEAKHKTDDSHIYTYSGGEYKLYKIESIGRNTVSALPIKTEDYEPLYRMPCFSLVGIFQVKGYGTDLEEIPKKEIKGKLVFVTEAYACTIAKILLDEAV